MTVHICFYAYMVCMPEDDHSEIVILYLNRTVKGRIYIKVMHDGLLDSIFLPFVQHRG